MKIELSSRRYGKSMERSIVMLEMEVEEEKNDEMEEISSDTATAYVTDDQVMY